MSRNVKKKESWYTELIKALRLETTTPSGRVNLAGVALVALFCLIYTASDGIQYAISAITDMVKTIALKQDIYHPYEGVSVFKATIPIIIAFSLCLLFLIIDSKLKQKISETKGNDKAK